MKKSNAGKCLSLICAFLFLFVLFSFAQETATNADGSNMLWKVSTEEGLQGYLVGSIHVVKPDIYPLNEAYQQAFDKSDVIGFELDFDSLQVKSRSLVPKLGFYPKGESLEGHISADTYQLLQQRLDSLGQSSARFRRMEPWFVSILIPRLQLQQAGYSGQSSIDNHFYIMAKEADKERMALETAEYQYKLFDGLSPELQEKFLKYTLQEAKRNLQLFDKMMSAWKSGNAEKLNEIMQGELKKITGAVSKIACSAQPQLGSPN